MSLVPPFVIPLVLFLTAALWVWALVDLVKSRSMDSTSRLIWTLVVLLVPFFGSCLYFLFGKLLATSSDH